MRNVLELGLLSIYWDIYDQAYIDIQNWLKSKEDTPFRKEIFTRLSTHQNIKDFDRREGIFTRTRSLYTKLSGFSHTKGYGYSSRKLNAHSNVNRFNEDSLKRWLGLVRETVAIVTVFHVLKYPVALQYTPLEDKFGINGPVGGFLRPDQVENIKKIVPTDLIESLQEISNKDPEAIVMTKWVNDQPDITQEEFERQLQKEDEDWIQRQGYKDWLKNHRFLHSRLKDTNPNEYEQRLAYNKKLKKWAKENNFLERGANPILKTD